MTQSLTTAKNLSCAELNQAYIACHICDALWSRPQLDHVGRAVCLRCGSTLLNDRFHSVERTVALTLAGLILFIVAIFFPFLHLERAGVSNRISIIDAVYVLWLNRMYALSVASALFILVFPLFQLVVFFTLSLLQLRRRPLNYFHALALRFTYRIAPWSMAEIFMIGVIVSLVKVGELADITVGPAFWAMASLNLVLLLTTAFHSRECLWQEIRYPQ